LIRHPVFLFLDSCFRRNDEAEASFGNAPKGIQLMTGRSDLQTPHPDFFVNAFDTFGSSEIVALPNSENPAQSGLIFQAEGF
jgi:hypothetical protein